MNCPVFKCKNNERMTCSVVSSVELDENAQCRYYIGPFVDPDIPPKVAYLCDRRYCPKCNNVDCHYTCDINHAINFIKNMDGNFMENEVGLDDH